MTDITKAKEILEEDNMTCVLCRGSILYSSKKPGVSPMLDFLSEGVDLNGFSAADKIIGKAAAMLFVCAGVCEVYGEVMSQAAIPVLEKHNVRYSYKVLTERINNRRGDGICPMEETVMTIDEPLKAEKALRDKLEELKKHK